MNEIGRSQNVLAGLVEVDSSLPLVRREPPKLGGDARNDAVPIAERGLPEQARGWIPGAGFTIERPAPIGLKRNEHPKRSPHSTGEMRDCRVGGDHQIRKRNHRRRVGKIHQLTAYMRNAALTSKLFRVLAADITLNADKAR